MADLIQIRGDTAANWNTYDPTLEAREIGIETDTYRLKVGDGSTAWTALPYFAVSGVNEQSGTSYTLALTDIAKIVVMDNASANTLTIPADASVAFPTGVIIAAVQGGAGATTITAASGVTLNGVSAGSATISAQYDGVNVYKRGANEWGITGAHGGVS